MKIVQTQSGLIQNFDLLKGDFEVTTNTVEKIVGQVEGVIANF